MFEIACPQCGNVGRSQNPVPAGAKVRCKQCRFVWDYHAIDGRAGPVGHVPSPVVTLERPDELGPRVAPALPPRGIAARVVPAATPVPIVPTLPVETVELVPCYYCGEPIRREAKKCKHCGEFLDASARPVQLAPVLAPVPVAAPQPAPQIVVNTHVNQTTTAPREDLGFFATLWATWFAMTWGIGCLVKLFVVGFVLIWLVATIITLANVASRPPDPTLQQPISSRRAPANIPF